MQFLRQTTPMTLKVNFLLNGREIKLCDKPMILLVIKSKFAD